MYKCVHTNKLGNNGGENISSLRWTSGFMDKKDTVFWGKIFAKTFCPCKVCAKFHVWLVEALLSTGPTPSSFM